MAALGQAWQRRRGLLLDVVPTVFALAVMFWAGLAPLKSLPGPDFELADKVWHAAAFGGLAGLMSRSFVYLERPALRAARDACAVSVALGGLIEVLQSFTAYRSADWADWLADAIGVGLAYAVLRGLNAAARPQTGAA